MNELQIRLVNFSVAVMELSDPLYGDPKLKSLASQVSRSSGSIGANYSEGQSANSRKDFHNKIRISLKEARETEYWLSILAARLKNNPILGSLLIEAEEIIKILTAIARKTDPNENHR